MRDGWSPEDADDGGEGSERMIRWGRISAAGLCLTSRAVPMFADGWWCCAACRARGALFFGVHQRRTLILSRTVSSRSSKHTSDDMAGREQFPNFAVA